LSSENWRLVRPTALSAASNRAASERAAICACRQRHVSRTCNVVARGTAADTTGIMLISTQLVKGVRGRTRGPRGQGKAQPRRTKRARRFGCDSLFSVTSGVIPKAPRPILSLFPPRSGGKCRKTRPRQRPSRGPRHLIGDGGTGGADKPPRIGASSPPSRLTRWRSLALRHLPSPARGEEQAGSRGLSERWRLIRRRPRARLGG